MDESIALVAFSKHSERVRSKPFDYAHIEVGLEIWNPHRPYAERRKVLRDHYGFDCACGRCAAERKALLAKARHRAR